MTGNKIAKAAAAVVLAASLILTVPGAAQPAAATSLSELQQRQSDLKEKGQALDAQLQKLKDDKAKQQQYKDALDAKIVNVEQQIDGKSTEIRQLDADILKKETAIAGKQKKIDADFQKLKQRVYALYLTGEASNLEIILNAKSVMDLADKSELLRVISKHDTDLMNTLKSDIEGIRTQKAAIEKNRQAVSSARTALEQDRQQLKTLSDESAKLLTTLSRNQQEIESEQEQCRIDQNSAQSDVNQWLSNYYASQSSSGGSAGGATGGSGGTPGALPSNRVSAMVSVAQQYVGCSYLWGGSTPPSFDCSGYVSYVVNHSGWNVGRLGVDGLSSICTPVSSSEARPGDLVFYNYTYGGLPNSHVGIYLGNGTAIQCDDPGVEYVNLGSSYWRRHLAGFGRLP